MTCSTPTRHQATPPTTRARYRPLNFGGKKTVALNLIQALAALALKPPLRALGWPSRAEKSARPVPKHRPFQFRRRWILTTDHHPTLLASPSRFRSNLGLQNRRVTQRRRALGYQCSRASAEIHGAGKRTRTLWWEVIEVKELVDPLARRQQSRSNLGA
jgi:hypothetical protein